MKTEMPVEEQAQAPSAYWQIRAALCQKQRRTMNFLRPMLRVGSTQKDGLAKND